MGLTYTQHTLEKLETLLKAMHFKVRYEKGNFKTGACILENSRVIMVNRFSNLESKILSLSELIQNLDVSEEIDLDEKQKSFLYLLKQTKFEF